MSAMSPVRELESGARPRDWMDGAFSANDGSEHFNDAPGSAEHAPARADGVTTSAEHVPAEATSAQHAPARLEPQRYKVQFEASEEYVALVEKAQALLSQRTPRADLSELHLRAMRTLVAELERQKYAVTARPRRRAANYAKPGCGQGREAESKHESEPESKHHSQPKPEHESEARHECERESESESRPEHPRQRGRHDPAAIRRAVFERDHGRCSRAART